MIINQKSGPELLYGIMGVISLIIIWSGNVGRGIGYEVLIAGLAILVHKRYISIRNAYILLFGIGLGIIGWFFDFYERFLYYDAAIHFINAGLIAYISGEMLPLKEGRMSDKAVFIGGIFLAMTIGFLWEIFEWTVGYFAPSIYKFTGKADTLSDLIFDLCGALIGSMFWLVRKKGRIIGKY
jgi:hypothetical protein